VGILKAPILDERCEAADIEAAVASNMTVLFMAADSKSMTMPATGSGSGSRATPHLAVDEGPARPGTAPRPPARRGQ
jgi:hypothetical protein